MGKMTMDKDAYQMPVLWIELGILLNSKLKRKEKKINTPQRVDLRILGKVGSIPSIRIERQSI